MHAEIIAIGTELTTGAKLDTNSQWLSLELAEVGIPVLFHSTVADGHDNMLSVFRIASRRADLVLITGGLGPTLDDLTRAVMADLAGVDLVLDEPSLDIIKSMFARRGREMPERNVIQAQFPRGSEVIANPRGTAPGIWMELTRDDGRVCRMAAMPGVPSEMRHMFFESVRPRLPGGRNVIQRARVNCFGIGESNAEEMLGDLTARDRDPEVGITAHEATITLRITAHGASADECQTKIAATKSDIIQKLGHYVFGEEDERLEDVVMQALADRGETVSVAESATAGLLALRLMQAGGAGSSFVGGVVSPTPQSKSTLLGIDESESSHGDPSGEIAKRMAEACRERFRTDYALAISDHPHDGEQQPDEVRATYIALATRSQTLVQGIVPVGDPAIQKSRLAKSLTNMLRLELRNHSESQPS
ncbi:MAG: CinA family nicotinamide mononucleotide deamidase-related protein [Planctomycetota bacterium]|nr:CinA family nicotinamide mononucleotide deamidase-related protein [Planctomycetota bacterium]